jgi:signal peptidase II
MEDLSTQETLESSEVPFAARTSLILKVLLPVLAGVVALDQYTKHLVLQNIEFLEIIPVIDGVFNLTLHFNKGAAFGMFHDLPNEIRLVTLWGVSAIAVGAVLYFLFREYYASFWGRLSLSLILGGAFGNAIDRVVYGHVVDFLDFYYGTYHWPAFNVADSAISVGAVILICLTLFSPNSDQ